MLDTDKFEKWIKCPVCNFTKCQSQKMTGRNEKSLNIYFCYNCSHVFQGLKTYKDIYSSGYFSLIARSPTNVPTAEKIKSLDHKAFNRYRIYLPYFKTAKRCLEIGSSIGSFLHLLKLNGKQIEGVEPDPDYSKFSISQYGFKQKNCLFDNFLTIEKFDIIFSFHVIEHVKSPIDYLKKSYNLLNDKGRVIIECPSWEIHSNGNLKYTL
jgi:SAM-dependent methyltransferase